RTRPRRRAACVRCAGTGREPAVEPIARVYALTTALRSWAWILLSGPEPLEVRKQRCNPFYAAADELDDRPLAGWCDAYAPAVLEVLRRELAERQQGRKCWALAFARVPERELVLAISRLQPATLLEAAE
ncbi:MAG: hypothetical protein K8H88_27940, partial [Sandaracinaceae bacterium]|nr:hypothetical protein [Sandaracinaceae bacterium]